MGIENRPYIGSWRLDSHGLVQHTPDALVYINGDTSLPGCPKCNGRIDIQKFVTEVSVDAGTDAGAASASFTLAIPLHHGDSFARDAKFILRPGLEVHIYERGYFPVKGMYANLAETQDHGALKPSDPGKSTQPSDPPPKSGKAPKSVAAAFDRMAAPGTAKRKMIDLIYDSARVKGHTPAFGVAAVWQAKFESGWLPDKVNPGKNPSALKREGVAYGLFQLNRFGKALGTSNPNFRGGREAGTKAQAEADPDHIYNAQDPQTNIDRFMLAGEGQGKNQNQSLGDTFVKLCGSGLGTGGGSSNPEVIRRAKAGEEFFKDAWTDPQFNQKSLAGKPLAYPPKPKVAVDPAKLENEDPSADAPNSGDALSLLDQSGLAGHNIENVLAYPYYHVFHGVVTQVGHSYSGGVNTISIQCASMLHFWEYHKMSTNASVFGARPTNSKLQLSLVGHNFTGMHPYQIIHTLHYDMAGAAGGVGWALSQKTNQTAKSEISGESFFSLNVKYWEKRFNSRMIKLRMHGATGEMFTEAQSLYLSRLSAGQLTRLIRNRFPGPAGKHAHRMEPLEGSTAIGLFNKRKKDRLQSLVVENKKTGKGFDLVMSEMQAFVLDIGQMGQVSFFESAYESKLDIAQKVCEVTGFEFYQDVDGDFVFKPPMYNLDTSSSRIYRIEDLDIISINFDEKEPQATYITIKNGHFQNIVTGSVENEWGRKGQYIDYRLVAQFGWRPHDLETTYYNDTKSLFFAGINRLDVLNAPCNSASVTIPLRPEIRPGYPVYIPYLDCFYYCNSFAHSYSVGGQCTTALQLIAKRAKFYAPGHIDGSIKGIDAIDLANTSLPERPLEVLGADGSPRLAGFPNTVMALDPENINPLFFVVGSDIERIDHPQTLQNLLKMAESLKILKKVEGQENVYEKAVVEGQDDKGNLLPGNVRIYFGNKPQGVGEGALDILAAAQEYVKKQEKFAAKQVERQKDLVKIHGQVAAIQAQIKQLEDKEQADEAEKEAESKGGV